MAAAEMGTPSSPGQILRAPHGTGPEPKAHTMKRVHDFSGEGLSTVPQEAGPLAPGCAPGFPGPSRAEVPTFP